MLLESGENWLILHFSTIYRQVVLNAARSTSNMKISEI